MKNKIKAFLAICFVLVIHGCATIYHWDIGQTQENFIKANTQKAIRHLSVVESSTTSEVYRTDFGYNDLFFYFSNKILIKVDRGKRSPDIIIQNNH